LFQSPLRLGVGVTGGKASGWPVEKDTASKLQAQGDPSLRRSKSKMVQTQGDRRSSTSKLLAIPAQGDRSSQRSKLKAVEEICGILKSSWIGMEKTNKSKSVLSRKFAFSDRNWPISHS
jgi:hypothetical protein